MLDPINSLLIKEGYVWANHRDASVKDIAVFIWQHKYPTEYVVNKVATITLGHRHTPSEGTSSVA